MPLERCKMQRLSPSLLTKQRVRTQSTRQSDNATQIQNRAEHGRLRIPTDPVSQFRVEFVLFDQVLENVQVPVVRRVVRRRVASLRRDKEQAEIQQTDRQLAP